jgi:predicted RNA binding protein YcfA (HicA-like mRNA interferase family)
MGKGAKLLEQMRRNPRGDWRINDIETVAAEFGFIVHSPKRGSHYVVHHPDHTTKLTVPARRPIKPIYIRLFVQLVGRSAGK